MLAVLSTTSVTRKQDSARAGRGSTDEPARSRCRHITSLRSISISMKPRMDTLQLTPQHDTDLTKVFSEITPGKAMQYFPSFRYLIFSFTVSCLTPNDPYMGPNNPYIGRTAPLTSRHCILYIYSPM